MEEGVCPKVKTRVAPFLLFAQRNEKKQPFASLFSRDFCCFRWRILTSDEVGNEGKHIFLDSFIIMLAMAKDS